MNMKPLSLAFNGIAESGDFEYVVHFDKDGQQVTRTFRECDGELPIASCDCEHELGTGTDPAAKSLIQSVLKFHMARL